MIRTRVVGGDGRLSDSGLASPSGPNDVNTCFVVTRSSSRFLNDIVSSRI